MTQTADVVVIGGGPIGATAARCAAEAGAHVLLLERRTRGTSSSSCTGLVSPRTLPALGASDRSILRSIRSVEAHAPDGRRVRIRAKETKALVLDRDGLEEELLQRAEAAGVRIDFDCHVSSVRPGHIECQTSGGACQVRAPIAIVAAGPGSALATNSDLPSPPLRLATVQALIEGTLEADDQVAAYVGSQVAPGFFAWAVPAEEGVLRVGLATSAGKDPSLFLDRLLRLRFPDARVITRAGGKVAIGPVADPVRDGILLVGDAAGQVKPLSGGGLYIGGVCARIAGRLAADAVRSERLRRDDLFEYVRRCNRAVGRELRFGMAVRRLLDSLTDERISEAVAALDHPELVEFLAQVGDIDRLRRIPRELAKQRRLWRRLLPFLGLLDAFLVGQTSPTPVAPTLSDFL